MSLPPIQPLNYAPPEKQRAVPTTRAAFTVLATAACWLAVSLWSVGDRHNGYFGNLWMRLEQATHFDEELIAFGCFLLFSIAVAVHLVAIRYRAAYRVRFLPAQLGAAYAVVALILGSILRQSFHQPWDDWFHVAFTLVAVAGFVALFGRPYSRILRHEAVAKKAG
ncbi:MAG: hypothetical protein IT445_07525 [Phycisphaeraceae bacterium]|nr:hypothetical protein [Phycisphaeraceae bacterium]